MKLGGPEQERAPQGQVLGLRLALLHRWPQGPRSHPGVALEEDTRVSHGPETKAEIVASPARIRS